MSGDPLSSPGSHARERIVTTRHHSCIMPRYLDGKRERQKKKNNNNDNNYNEEANFFPCEARGKHSVFVLCEKQYNNS